MITEIAVVIPARDEAQLIGACLDSVAEARRMVGVGVVVTVVADGCRDATAEIARGYDGVLVVELEASNVGTARAHGVRSALALLGSDPERIWLANTDADSIVPRNWLAEQLLLADRGCDVMVGTVRPSFSDLTEEQVRAWSATHHPGRPNGHVHGANLGIRASTYLAAGGYQPVAEHEDNDLVDRVAGASIVATDSCEVVTSGRLVGRTPGGYARFLRENLLRGQS